MKAFIDGIGLLGPGLPGWSASRAVLAGSQPFEMQPLSIPASDWLPPPERRRTGSSVRLALAVGREACEHARMAPRTLATVFTSSGGDGDNQHAICETLASAAREVSPTRFHNSVHNAPAGYWGVATGSMESSTTLCAFDWSFTAGLVEALTWIAFERRPILVVAYDIPYPEPLRAIRPIPHPFGVALLLSPARSGHSIAELALGFVSGPTGAALPPGLAQLHDAIPAARGLPVLHGIARGDRATVALEYLEGRRLSATLSPT